MGYVKLMKINHKLKNNNLVEGKEMIMIKVIGNLRADIRSWVEEGEEEEIPRINIMIKNTKKKIKMIIMIKIEVEEEVGVMPIEVLILAKVAK